MRNIIPTSLLINTLLVLSVLCSSFVSARQYELLLGPYLSQFKTKETESSAKEKGGLYGIFGRYESHFDGAAVLFDLAYASGDLDYEGDGEADNIANSMVEIRGAIGRDFLWKEKYRITPFVGMGYRNLNDDANKRTTSTGEDLYREETIYVYNPIGVRVLSLSEEGAWIIGGRIEYENFINGKVNRQLSATSNYDDVTLRQGNGRGFRFSMDFTHLLTDDGRGIIIEPFYRYWDIAESDTVVNDNGSWVEPENTSSEWGVNVMLSF